MPGRRALALLGALLAAALLTACSSTPETSTGSGSRPPGPSYVALGDSYTSAPYVYLTDLAGGCLRSDHDYPALVAKALHARPYRNVACAAARTRDLFHAQRTFGHLSVPPQLAAVRPSTRLVTVGIGGNDFGLFYALVHGCPVQAIPGQRVTTTGVCGSVDVRAARHRIDAVGPHITQVVDAVRRRAPRATVVVIGYPRLVSPASTCPPRLLPISRRAATVLDGLTRRLDAVEGSAATRAGARYVDLYRASRGHDICSKDPWVNGVRTDTAKAAALHPFLIEQQAAARLVEAAYGAR